MVLYDNIPGTDDDHNFPPPVRVAFAESPEMAAHIGSVFNAYLGWNVMNNATPDLAIGKQKFKRTLTANETLNAALGSDGDTFTIRYIASGGTRTVTLGANMVLSADMTELPPIVQNYSNVLTFLFSGTQNKWVCISVVSGV